MSINPETDLDLEKLFLPAWAQETSSTNRYAKFTGNEGAPRSERRGDDRSGPRPPRRDGGGAGRGFGGPRPGGPGRGPGGPRRDGGPGDRSSRDDRGSRRDDRREPRAPEVPLPDLTVTIVPDERGVESLARQIKMTGRAYPLFGIALIILQKPERYSIRFAVKKNAEGQPVQPLFVCALDETLWLSEDEAIEHVLHKHFATFYQAERTATEPPKGTYTFVGQCGLSGVILGPPNHHDYQNQLRKLHAGRFARMPFEMFKSRVKIVRDEAVVKQWVEEQSWKTEFICLNVPEPLKLASRGDVEQHFRATHKDTIIKPVESHTLNGAAARGIRCQGLARLAHLVCDEQRRFPLQMATVLSQQFAGHGLQFFKVNKTVTHVSVARPHFLDLETTPVSEGVKRIVEFINAHPKCTRRRLFEALAPSPPPAPIPVNPPAADAEPSAPTPPTAAEAAVSTPEAAEPTPEQTAVNADLHWLIHQGHVIEFANGMLDTAKRPLPRPPKPEKRPAESPVETPSPVATSEPTTAEAIIEPETPPAEPAANLAAEPPAESVSAPEVPATAPPPPMPAAEETQAA
jgi:hypothetical protein